MKKTMLFAVLAAALSARAETIMIEAEWFEDWGGWVNDTQFMDQMGSPFLLAHGMGKPVADAKTAFIAEGGKYSVWVRTRNWTYHWHPDAGAGTFSLVVNGKTLPTVLGTQGKGEWLWTKADDVVLKTGKNKLALHDCDGFDGRVDAVCFTTEADPSATLNGPRHPLHALDCEHLPKFDLCVVGGGVAGICTAVSAARLGLSVALVHDRPVLGGNNSSEVRVHLGAYQNLPPYPRLGDVLAEFGPVRGGNAESAANYEDEKKLAIVEAEKNIRLFLNEHVNGVKTNETGRILSVRSVNTRTGVATWYEAANFVDCTGDGNLGFLAGADWRMGREAKSETKEPSAPAKADMITMGASVQWNAGKTSGDAAFPSRPWMLKAINEENCSPHLKGDWWWEAGLGRDQIAEGEYIRDYGLLVAYSNWAFVKNFYSKKDSFADKELKWVAYNAGNMRYHVDHRPAPPEDGARVEVRGRAVPVELAQREDMAVSGPVPLLLFAQRAEPLHGRTRHIGHAHRPWHDAPHPHARNDGRGRRHGGDGLQEARMRSARRLFVAPRRAQGADDEGRW